MRFRQGEIFRIDRIPRLDIKRTTSVQCSKEDNPMRKQRAKNTGELRKIYTNGDSIQVCIPKRQAAERGIKPGSYVKCFSYDTDRNLAMKEGNIVLGVV